MAFMQTTGGTSGEFSQILAYKAPSGRLFLRDRAQNSAGDWEATETDVTKAEPAFAVDFGRLEIGWCHFAAGAAPQWNMVPYGRPLPERPPSPGRDDKGKELNYRNGFRVPVAGNAIGGVRELAGNSNALITGMNELHTQFEKSPEAAAGKIPVVKMADTIAVKAGQSTNFQPVFQIVAWVDRPDVLGPRTVPAPAGHMTAAAGAAMGAAQMQPPVQRPPETPPPVVAAAARPAAAPAPGMPF